MISSKKKIWCASHLHKG